MPESSPEYVQVELPFIQQLQAMGWDYLPGGTGKTTAGVGRLLHLLAAGVPAGTILVIVSLEH